MQGLPCLTLDGRLTDGRYIHARILALRQACLPRTERWTPYLTFLAYGKPIQTHLIYQVIR